MLKHTLLTFCFTLSFLIHIKASSNIELSNKNVSLHTSRIVNGTRAELGQFPQQVSLRRRYTQNHFCAGTILSSEWILTAAHCMFDPKTNLTLKPADVLVIAGEIILKNTNRAHAWSRVTNLIVHPEFSNETLQNDLALLKLETSLKFDDRVKPASIAPRPAKGTLCEVSGWGYPEFNVTIIQSYLMFVQVPLLSDRLCRKFWEGYIVPEGTFCAGYCAGGKDACTGDSGGGLVCNGILTGHVSGGMGCATPRTPGLYSDIYFFLPWISQFVDL